MTASLELVTIKEAAGRLKVHPTTLLRAIADGKLEAVLMGSRYRVSEEALKRYVDGLTVNKMEESDNASSSNTAN